MTYLQISSLVDIKHQPVIGDLIYGSDSYYAQITRVGESIVEFDVIGPIAIVDASDIPQLEPSKINQDENNRFVTDTQISTWNGKQDALVSGTNIKTVGGESILGSGNIPLPSGGLTVESWNTATKTLALSDANKLFICSYSSDQTLTIPTNATVEFPIGTMITFSLISTYKVTFVGASGVTLTSIDSLVELATENGMASLIKINENAWQLVGALE